MMRSYYRGLAAAILLGVVGCGREPVAPPPADPAPGVADSELQLREEDEFRERQTEAQLDETTERP